MKKITFVTLWLFLAIKSYGQDNVNTPTQPMETTNLFEYGHPISSADANFRNLFKNFPILVSSGDVKLLSYEFVQEIKNCKQAKIFLKKNSKLASLSPSVLMGMNPSAPETSQIRIVFKMPADSKAEKENEYLNLAKANCVDGSLLVYSIKLAMAGKTCNYYTFVEPKTNRIKLSGNFFGFSLPTSYAIYKEKNSSGI